MARLLKKYSPTVEPPSKHDINLQLLVYTFDVRKQRIYRPKIVLAGGGHAHLYTLRRVTDLTRNAFDVTLVLPLLLRHGDRSRLRHL